MTRATRDVIVVGASAGGIDAVRRLLSALPGDLPATLFVVIHTGGNDPQLLTRAIGKSSPLPVVVAAEGDSFARRQVYVPPTDRHLLVGNDHVHVRRGPRENSSRPAIDPLFRSAAVACTTRVIGLVLTGLLNDGAAGLRAIKRCGGIAVVQDPADAAFDAMPRSAIGRVDVDHVRPLDQIPPLLVELAAQERPALAGEVDEDLRMEDLIAAQEVRDMRYWSRSGTISPLTCPDCHGAMQEIRDGELVRYRCHTGHAYTLETLGAAQADAWERALYGAYRAQHERSVLLRRMAEEASRRGSGSIPQLEERARSYEEGAELLRRLLAHGNGAAGADPSSGSELFLPDAQGRPPTAS